MIRAAGSHVSTSEGQVRTDRPGSSERSRDLANSLHAPREARDHVTSVLHEWGLTGLADLAVLLVSELVTNAVRYSAGPIGLRMVRDGDRLLVEVRDSGPDLPAPRMATADEENGRGLLLVDQLSADWGARREADGKVVWLALDAPQVADSPETRGPARPGR